MNVPGAGRLLPLLLVLLLPIPAGAQTRPAASPRPTAKRTAAARPGATAKPAAGAPRRPAASPVPVATGEVRLVVAQCDCGVRHETREARVTIALDKAGNPVPEPFRLATCVHNANAVPASDYVVWENRTGMNLIVQFPENSPLANGARALQLGRGPTRIHLGKVRPGGGRRGEYPYVISRPGDGKCPPVVLRGAALVIGD